MKALTEMIEEARRRAEEAKDFEMKTLKIPPAQAILQEQGYLVIASKDPSAVGKVWPTIHGGHGYEDIPGPVVVVGESTYEEWARQCLQYSSLGRVPSAATFEYFYRVIAE